MDLLLYVLHICMYLFGHFISFSFVSRLLGGRIFPGLWISLQFIPLETEGREGKEQGRWVGK